jgi:cobalt-precorrin-6B (C15)-methyltransferase
MWKYKTPGVPDGMFLQSEAVPGPTKEEIRVLTIAKARLCEGAVVVDVGCGTGGLTVEAALQVSPKGKVYAVDQNEEALKLTQSNVEKFGLQTIVEMVRGAAPQALQNLPVADVFLIGGSQALKETIQLAHSKLKTNGRIIVNAILLETATTAVEEMQKVGFKEVDVTEIFVAKGKAVNSGTMMIARNPITIVSATKGDQA